MVRVSSPGPLVNVSAVVVTALLLEDMSRQVAHQASSWFCLWPLTVVLACVYFVRLVILRPFGGNDATRPTSWRWSLAPVCGLVVVSAAIYPWPMAARFAFSRTAFEVARASLEDDGSLRSPGWIGWFPIQRIERRPGGRIDFVVGVTGSGDVTISYVPNEVSAVATARQIDGRWFALELGR